MIGVVDSASFEAAASSPQVIETDVPWRLERLPWGRFHVLVIVALGITWILDGLEVTLAGSVVGALKTSPVLHFTDTEVGFAASAYILGAVLGALGFGWLTDRWGRRRLFFITIALYLVATALTGLSWSASSFFVFRFFTGAGIGGEYAAINSTIQELVPARYRGFTDIVINGSFWIGAALGAFAAVALLNPAWAAPEFGWRLAFGVGACLGVIVFFMRMWIPESPRWLAMRGRLLEAEKALEAIEDVARSQGHALDQKGSIKPLRLRTRDHTPLGEVFAVLLKRHPGRTALGLTLMAAQAFFYNAIFFTYALVLTKFYAVKSEDVGWYIFPFALGNFLGPLLLGRFFDTLGRRIMIGATYTLSGILLLASGALFEAGYFTSMTQTIAWTIVFFVASPAASAAYLTVSETFPIEIRGLTIAIFYALGTAIGGVAGPIVFAKLIESGSRASLFGGYAFASALMVVAGAVAFVFAIPAERRPLEDVAEPLSSA